MEEQQQERKSVKGKQAKSKQAKSKQDESTENFGKKENSRFKICRATQCFNKKNARQIKKIKRRWPEV